MHLNAIVCSVGLNSLRPSDAYRRHWTGPSLVQVMVHCLFGTKALSGPMTTVKFLSKLKHSHWRNCIWKCRLPKWRPSCPNVLTCVKWSSAHGIYHYTPAQRSWKGGILESGCPSVRLSVCGHNPVTALPGAILLRSQSNLTGTYLEWRTRTSSFMGDVVR